MVGFFRLASVYEYYYILASSVVFQIFHGCLGMSIIDTRALTDDYCVIMRWQMRRALLRVLSREMWRRVWWGLWREL